MTTWIVLLRGINVGGHGKLPMMRLRELAVDAGLGNPRTYIQSGNLIVDADLDEAAVLAALSPLLAAELGRPVPVVARSSAVWATILAATPFPDPETPKSVHVWLFANPVARSVREAVAQLAASATGGEQVGWGERELYLHTPAGFGVSKFAEKLPRALAKDDPGTARNWATMTTLAGLAAS